MILRPRGQRAALHPDFSRSSAPKPNDSRPHPDESVVRILPQARIAPPQPEQPFIRDHLNPSDAPPRTRASRARLRGFATSCLLGVAALLPACSPADKYSSTPSFSTGETLLTTGEWNDLEAAARVGAEACQIAIASVESPSPDLFVFKLVTPTDEHGTLTARRRTTAPDHPTAAEGPIAIELHASLGLFGDSAHEKKLLRAVEARLTDLNGVDWAPIRKR